MSSMAALGNRMEETEPGVLRTRLITVLEHCDGSWLALAAQDTATAPAAAGLPPG